MRFLTFLEGVSGVRGFLVCNEDGEQLHASGVAASSAWSALRAAAIARDLGVAGAIAGLGTLSAAAVRSAQSSRVLAQSGAHVAVIELDSTRATADIETQLQDSEWISTDQDVSGGASDIASDHETLRPHMSPVMSNQATEVATVARVQEPALAPAPQPSAPVPPRPFQGLQSLATRAVPRPNVVTGSPTPRAVAPPPSPVGRPVRPPPTSRALAGATAVSLDAPSDPQQSARSLSIEEPTHARRSEASGASSALLTGSLATFALPDLLEFLRVGQRTGTLVCASDAGLGAINIKRGRITGAASPGVPGLGDWLVQRGLLSQEQLEEALRHHTQSGTKTQLGGTLATHELITREALHEAMTFHIGAVLRKLMTWETGAFTFDPAGPDAADASGDIEIEAQTVLLNIFKEMDDSRRG